MSNLSPEQRLRGLTHGEWPENSPDLFLRLGDGLSFDSSYQTPKDRILGRMLEERRSASPLSSVPSWEMLQQGPTPEAIREIEIHRIMEKVRRRSKELIASYGKEPEGLSLSKEQGAKLSAEVKEAMEPLAMKEKLTLLYRFGLEDGVARTLREVARIMNCSPSTVWNRERRALYKMRDRVPHLPEDNELSGSF